RYPCRAVMMSRLFGANGQTVSVDAMYDRQEPDSRFAVLARRADRIRRSRSASRRSSAARSSAAASMVSGCIRLSVSLIVYATPSSLAPEVGLPHRAAAASSPFMGALRGGIRAGRRLRPLTAGAIDHVNHPGVSLTRRIALVRDTPGWFT